MKLSSKPENLMTRDQIIEDEFVRAKPDGIRLFSPGLFTLARKLGVNRMLPPGDPRRGNGERDSLCLTWLMDERHTADEISDLADAGAEAAAPVLDAYAHQISMVLMTRCLAEVSRTEAAVAAIEFKVEAKPGLSGAPPAPSGK